MVESAFDGITVLDVTQGIAEPHSSMLPALHGADVIKIEPSEDDWSRALRPWALHDPSKMTRSIGR